MIRSGAAVLFVAALVACATVRPAGPPPAAAAEGVDAIELGRLMGRHLLGRWGGGERDLIQVEELTGPTDCPTFSKLFTRGVKEAVEDSACCRRAAVELIPKLLDIQREQMSDIYDQESGPERGALQRPGLIVRGEWSVVGGEIALNLELFDHKVAAASANDLYPIGDSLRGVLAECGAGFESTLGGLLDPVGSDGVVFVPFSYTPDRGTQAAVPAHEVGVALAGWAESRASGVSKVAWPVVEQKVRDRDPTTGIPDPLRSRLQRDLGLEWVISGTVWPEGGSYVGLVSRQRLAGTDSDTVEVRFPRGAVPAEMATREEQKRDDVREVVRNFEFLSADLPQPGAGQLGLRIEAPHGPRHVYYGEDQPQDGDELALTVSGRGPVYLYLYNIAQTGEVQRLFPNDTQRDNCVDLSAGMRFPPADAPFTINAQPPYGTDLIWAIVGDRPFVPDLEARLVEGSRPRGYGRVKTRGWAAVPKAEHEPSGRACLGAGADPVINEAAITVTTARRP